MSAPARRQKAFSTDCVACPRLARLLASVRVTHPGYHARPVPSFGPLSARLLIVGLAPGMHGANRTGRPFTGDHAGILLYRTLARFGFASAPQSLSTDDGLRLIDCRITNAVKCLPPANRPTTDEVRRCNGYLASELAALPQGAALLALGSVSHRAVLMALGVRPSACVFAHGAEHALDRGVRLFDSYHCSRYNTQTRRLTEAMFVSVVGGIAAYLERTR